MGYNIQSVREMTDDKVVKNCRNKRVFVTGGAGFIGSNLVKFLIEGGAKVLVYDKFIGGRRTFLPKGEKNFSIKKGDILDKENLSSTLSDFSPNIVIHLAAMHFIPDCEKYPSEALRINLIGTQNVIEACNNNVRLLMFASSAAVYPISDKPLREGDQITLKEIYGGVYGVTKAAGEVLVRHYSERSKTRCLALRFFNVYGPNETNPHLIPHILDELKKGNIIHLGNIKTKRDYIYVDDVCRAIIYLFEVKDKFGAYNIGTGKEYSAKEIVEIFKRITNRPLKIITKSNRKRKRDRMHLVADITKIKKVTGWYPQVKIEDGLRKLIEHELEK